ncbi:MAG: M24 family metallopeptidase [bacterium]
MAIELDIEPRIRDLGVVARVTEAVDASEVDAVIGLSVDVCQYLSGHWFPYARNRINRQNIAIWPKSAICAPALVVGVDQVPGPYRHSWIRDIRTYRERGRRPPTPIVESLAVVLTEMGLDDKTLGIERVFMPVAFHDELIARLPNAHLVGADDFFDRLRAVKTPEELALIREAAKAMELGLYEGLKATRPGWTEKQAAEAIHRACLDNGAAAVPTLLLGAGDGAKGFLPPTDDVLEYGQLVRTDLNVILGGYYADMGRMAVVGEPSDEQRRAYANQQALNQAVIDIIRPGVLASQVFHHSRKVAAELGVELLDQPFIGLGHAIGTNNSDFPKLNELDHTPLEVGMVLNIEPDIYGPQRELVHIEEMVYVGEDGTRRVTDYCDWSTLLVIEE